MKALCTIFIALTALFISAGDAGTFTREEEQKLGDRLLFEVRREFQIVEEPDVSLYVQRLGDRILAQAGSQYFTYHFFVVNSKEFNAFAAPSGLIFLHTGLLTAMDSEEEMLSVLAHEIGHTTARHLARRLEKSSKINMGTLALALAGAMMGGGGAVTEAMVAGSIAAGTAMQLAFSRQDEEEADRLAFGWMEGLDRDPKAMESMLDKMRRISQYSRGQIPAYLLTHPEPETRQGYVQDLLRFHRKKDYPPVDPFFFQRFKIRLACITGNADTLVARYKRQLEDDKATLFEKNIARYALSQVNLVEARPAEAEALLRQVIAAMPGYSLLHADLGRILFAEKEYLQAEAQMRQALRLDPDNGLAAVYLARILEGQGKKEEALRLLEVLVSQLPYSPDIHYQAGMLCAAMGRKGDGFSYLGMFSMLKGRLKEARDHLLKAVKDPTTSPRLRSRAKDELEKLTKIEKS